MAISPVASSAAASTAQSDAVIAQAKAQAANQQSLIDSNNDKETNNPILQVPAVKPTVNTNGQTIGTTINVSA
jgi:hypothetical protein